MNWDELFRACAERFGWHPDEVLRLTPRQAAAVLGAAERRRRTVMMTPQQYRQFLASRHRTG